MVDSRLPESAQSDEDLFDSLPIVGRATTQLERSFGPSCLLSLIIVLLLLVIFRRYFQLSWAGMFCVSFLVWFGVLMLLIRWRPDRVIDEE
jgi:hypothetical protein